MLSNKIKSCLLAVALTVGLLSLIASFSYLIVTNQEFINNFFGKDKENKLEVLNEKIKDVQSSEENNSNQLKKTIDEISEQLALMNKKYAVDQAALANKIKKINFVQQKELIDKQKVNRISKNFNIDDNEIKIPESGVTLEDSINKNIDLVTSVNDESVNKEFLKFTSSIQNNNQSEVGQPLGTIYSIITSATNYNPEVLKKGFDVESLRSSISVAESDKYPTVDFSGRAGQEYNWKENASGEKKSYMRDEFSLIAKQNLYDGGQTTAEINRVKADFQSNVYQLKQVRQDIALRAAFVYFDLIRYKEMLDQATVFIKSNFRTSKVASLRYDRRVSDASEFQAIKGRLENSKANFISAFNNFEDSRSRFKSIVGYLPSFDFPTKKINLEFINQKMIPESIQKMVDVSVLRHPTMLAAAQDIEEAKQEYRRTEAEGSPSVDFELSGIRTDNEYYGGNGTSDRRYGTAMLTLNYNIFDGGRIKSKKSEKFQQVKATEALYEQRKREVEDSARLAWRSYVSLIRQLDPLKKELDAAKLTDAVFDRQFSIGRSKLIETAEKKELVFEAQVNGINAEFDFLYSGFRVLHACGDILKLLEKENSEQNICK